MVERAIRDGAGIPVTSCYVDGMAIERLDPDCLRKLMADPDFQAAALAALERTASEYLGALPYAELTFGPMARVASVADFLLDELAINRDGFETPN